MLDLKKIRKSEMQKLKINRKMKNTENLEKNAKKKKKRKNQKGEEEINTRL